MKLVEVKSQNPEVEQLLLEYNQMFAKFRKLRQTFMLNKYQFEQVSVPTFSEKTPVDELQELLDNLSKRFEAARRGLGLANKLTGPTKSRHMSRVMINMNKIRGALRQAEKLVGQQIKPPFQQPEENPSVQPEEISVKQPEMPIEDENTNRLLHLIRVQSAYKSDDPTRQMPIDKIVGPLWRVKQMGGEENIERMLNVLQQAGKIKYDPNTRMVRFVDMAHIERKKSEAQTIGDTEQKYQQQYKRGFKKF